ncbi:MAG: PadR family transcriptional regulator [Ilumatobacteraceae bacterium]
MPHPHHDGPPRHRARRGAIKGSLLKLLAERPMHGYELIGELEERTGGRWRPSPGSVYPTLAQLEDEGLVRSFDDDGRKRFELTEAGHAWLAEHQDEEGTLPWERSAVGGGRGDMRRLGGEIFGQLRQLGRYGTPAQQEQARVILTRARTELYAVLAGAPTEAPTDEPTTAPPTTGTPAPAGATDDTAGITDA